MIIIREPALLIKEIDRRRLHPVTIGFVPTMGALHEGHISLIQNSRGKCDITICSIFVNPAQFNNKEDLLKYPRTLEKDIDMLEGSGCDILFLPEASAIYPEGYAAKSFDLGDLEKKWEGACRPGHFQGVCQIVSILIHLTNPNMLFLGEKDWQQCMVLSKLKEIEHWKTEVVFCPTLRESDGLAMSSRNMRLSERERKIAPAIYRALCCLKESLHARDLHESKNRCAQILKEDGLEIEYFAITDESLNEINRWDGKALLRGIVAAKLGGVRLIDNMQLTGEQLKGA